MDDYYLKSRYSYKDEIDWGKLVVKITFVLYVCDAIKEYIGIRTIADQAARTYPEAFLTMIGKQKVPDTYIIVTALKKAQSYNWCYVKGDYKKGWKLTRRGVQFSKDVNRRVKKKFDGE